MAVSLYNFHILNTPPEERAKLNQQVTVFLSVFKGFFQKKGRYSRMENCCMVKKTKTKKKQQEMISRNPSFDKEIQIYLKEGPTFLSIVSTSNCEKKPHTIL